MLFSGDFTCDLGAGIPRIKSLDVAGALAASHPQLLLVNESPIGRFLDRESGSKRSNELLIAKLDELFGGDREKIATYFGTPEKQISRQLDSSPRQGR